MDDFDRSARARTLWRYVAVVLGMLVVSLLIGIAVGRPFDFHRGNLNGQGHCASFYMRRRSPTGRVVQRRSIDRLSRHGHFPQWIGLPSGPVRLDDSGDRLRSTQSVHAAGPVGGAPLGTAAGSLGGSCAGSFAAAACGAA